MKAKSGQWCPVPQGAGVFASFCPDLASERRRAELELKEMGPTWWCILKAQASEPAPLRSEGKLRAEGLVGNPRGSARLSTSKKGSRQSFCSLQIAEAKEKQNSVSCNPVIGTAVGINAQ